MRTYLLALLTTLTSASFAQATEVRLDSIEANGSGCPIQNDKAIPYGFDGQWLTLELNQAYSIKVVKGSGISLEDSRKNCAITLNVQAPRGYRYAIERVVSWGSYQLGSNDQFVGSFDGFFAGSGDTFTSSSTANGPTGNQAYTFDRTFSGSNLVWSSCDDDRALTLNNAVRVAPRGNNGKFATWSTGSLDRIAYKFTYKACY